jgi:hypothetical protein
MLNIFFLLVDKKWKNKGIIRKLRLHSNSGRYILWGHNHHWNIFPIRSLQM